MAKRKKYPKSPKASASLKTWENYKAKVAAVDKFNNQIETDKKKLLSVIKQVQTMKSKR